MTLQDAEMHNKRWLRRFLSWAVVPWLRASGLSAAQLVRARLVLGALAALALATGPEGFVVGGGLFLLGLLLDRAVTALQELQAAAAAVSASQLRVHTAANALAFIGLGLGLRGSEFGVSALALGAIAAAGIAALIWLILRLDAIDGGRAAEFGGVYGFEAEDIMLLVPAALWLGWAEGLLVVAAFSAAALASAFYATHYRKFTAG